MPLVSSSITNLVNGVSQQPYTLRLSSQAEVQENALSTVAQGLKKRPPSKHVALLTPSSRNVYVHTINRDESERYTVVIGKRSLKVFGSDGREREVHFPSPAGLDYINSDTPRASIRCVTVADYTFVLNRDFVVAEDSSRVPTRAPEALVVVKVGLYSKGYTVDIAGKATAAVKTPAGTVAADAQWIATDQIAAQLAAQLNETGNANGITATATGSVIYISATSDFTITTSDGYSDTAMYAVKDKLQRFTDLPVNPGVKDFTLEIVGDKTSSFDNYWVRFDNSSGGPGVWRETAKPGITIGFNSDTLPWGLVRRANGSFNFQQINWALRTVGDEDSSPMPSFLGRKINDIFFYRNRLGFIADESVCFSEAGVFFNFHPTTVTDLLDSDRIDASVSHSKVSTLFAAVPFAKRLMLFSASTQFTVESGELLTPKTIAIKPTTEFACSALARPLGIGKMLYFTSSRGRYSIVREYFMEQDTDGSDAADVTSHVPQYLPANIFKMAVGLNEDLLCAISADSPNSVYVYKFYWNNNEKLQSSWSVWKFPEVEEVVNIDFIDSTLVLTIYRNGALYMETIDVDAVDPDAGEPYLVHLDRKVTIPAHLVTYTAPYSQINAVDMPYTLGMGDYCAVTKKGGRADAGVVTNATVGNGGVILFLGDISGTDLVFGRRYAFRYQFSPIVPKSTAPQGGERADTLARLQLRNLQVNYAATGYFQAKVTPQGRPTYTYTFTGKVLSLPSTTIGSINLETGKFRFPVMSQNTSVRIELVSESPLPCSFMSADWEGFYAKRSQGI